MNRILGALMCLLAASAFAQDEPADLSWLRRAQITAYRLDSPLDREVAAEHAVGVFHGRPVLEVHKLEPETARKLGEFLEPVPHRRFKEAEEARLHDQVTGGVWACVSGSEALRIEVDQATYDFIVECGLWIRPVDEGGSGPGSIRFVFSMEEAKQYFAIMNPIFKGPIFLPDQQ